MIQALTAAIIVSGAGMAVIDEYATYPGAPAAPARRVFLTPGALAWDGCDCDGSFLQTIVQKNPTEVFPIDSSNLPVKGGCQDRSMMWPVQALVIRCIHGLQTVNGKVYYPKPVDLNNDSIRQQYDEFIMRKAITCYLQSLKSARPQVIADYRVGASTFVGPEGNCGGVLLNYAFQVV